MFPVTKKNRVKLFLCCVLISWTAVFFQFDSSRRRHERLAREGIMVKADVDSRERYAIISFVTRDGQKITRTENGDSSSIRYHYGDNRVIYEPRHPSDYETYVDFGHYHLAFVIFFFFCLYGLGIGYLLYTVIRTVQMWRGKWQPDVEPLRAIIFRKK